MTQTNPLAQYPGHCYLETALFGRDLADGSSQLKLLDQIIHKRQLPKDAEVEKIKFSHTNFHTSKDQIPDGSLQLIRFVGLARDAPETADTHQDRRALAFVFSTLGFPLNPVMFALNSPRIEQGRVLVGNETDVDDKAPAFYVAGGRFCLIWRFDTATKSTRAVIVNYCPPSVELVVGFTPMFEAAIQYFNQCFSHPVFLFIPMVYLLRLDTISLYDEDAGILLAIENQVTVKSANRISTMQQLRDLVRLIGHDKFVLSTLRNSLEQARLFNERTYAEKEGGFREPIAKHYLAHLELQRDLLELDITFLKNMQENIGNQQAAISTIVNMQDGISMKTIAIITMVFLPGTFLASMFAMPVFPQGRADAFWLYWSICIPLTALVFAAWLAWFYWHTISKYYDDPQKRPLDDLKAWWNGLKSFRSPRAENKYQDHTRRRLAGDNHKEWIDNFHNPRTKRPSSQAGTVHKASSKENVQSV